MADDNEFSDLLLHEALPQMQPVVRWLATGNNNRNLIKQLIMKSHQAHILEYTPNDAARRFVDEQAYFEWSQDGHTVHWLLNGDYDLAGVMWYRSKLPASPVPGLENIHHTFAIRLYENYVGHRLSAPFMLLSLRIFRQDLKNDDKPLPGLWLETTVGNEIAIRSYLKFGFREIHRDDEHVYMIMNSSELNQVIDAG